MADPDGPTQVAEVVVNGYRFDTDFWTRTHPNDDDGSNGHSFFLTSNALFSSNASFHILDSADSKQWECSNSSRMRRLFSKDNVNEIEEETNTQRTAADLSQKNQWGSGSGSGKVEDSDREGVYVVQTGNRFFRVTCSVNKKRTFMFIGAHRNSECFASPIVVASPVPKNVKVCKESGQSTAEFIQKALEKRDKYLDKHVPKDKDAFLAVSEGYNQMKNNCSSFISSDTDAKVALHQFGQNINERIVEFNKKNPSARLPMVNPFANK